MEKSRPRFGSERKLTLPMVRALSKLLQIPSDILVQHYKTQSAA